MSNKDPDIEVMLDALGNTQRIFMAERFMHVMQDHNPGLFRCEGIIGMMVGVFEAVPPEAHDKFSAPLQALSSAWNDFIVHANSGAAPYALSPELTRILKTISYIELEDHLFKPEPVQQADIIAQSWDIAYILDKTQKRAAYFGPSHCMALDIAHDDLMLQLETRRADFLARAQAAPNSQPKPPQP